MRNAETRTNRSILYEKDETRRNKNKLILSSSKAWTQYGTCIGSDPHSLDCFLIVVLNYVVMCLLLRSFSFGKGTTQYTYKA